MFAVYVNYMPEIIGLFADDAKLLKRLQKNEDCEALQQDLDKIFEWSCTWEMEFNTKKMEFEKSKRRHRGVYPMRKDNINEKKAKKYLGVTIIDNMSPEKHMNNITGEIYNLLRNIWVAFTYVDEDMIKKLITTFVHLRLEYTAKVWLPSKKKHKKTGENTESSNKAFPKFERTVIQREAAGTGSYNIGAEEEKRRYNNSVKRDEGIRKTR